MVFIPYRFSYFPVKLDRIFFFFFFQRGFPEAMLAVDLIDSMNSRSIIKRTWTIQYWNSFGCLMFHILYLSWLGVTHYFANHYYYVICKQWNKYSTNTLPSQIFSSSYSCSCSSVTSLPCKYATKHCTLRGCS